MKKKSDMLQFPEVTDGDWGYIKFTKLWKVMTLRKLNQQFLLDHGIAKETIRRLKSNGNVSCVTLAKLCYILDVKPYQIMDYREPDPQWAKEGRKRRQEQLAREAAEREKQNKKE